MSAEPPPKRRPSFELLAPAGNWDCARAAVENGADAVYFGLEAGFNARVRAANFSLRDLAELMQYLHQRSVRGFVTLNTLVFSDELETFAKHVEQVASAGVDAVLVQDLGAARLVHQICPELELHASTQMTLTSTAGLRLAEQLQLKRVVLPRELSIDEIRQIGQSTSLELEAFVHGALCVAYSGQCLTSESLGGRSANRGHCAQACRLPYELICDGQDVDLGDVQYLLSPQDLAAYALLPDLMAAGVTSFKIEGRLKTPEYVANVTCRYREALEQAIAKRNVSLSERAVEELELSFSRGFSPGWLGGSDHKMLVPGLSSAKRGIHAATVMSVEKSRVRVKAHHTLQTGDGVVFAGDRAHDQELGGRIWEIFVRGDSQTRVTSGFCELTFHHDLNVESLYAGQFLWKTDDPQLTKRLRATFAGPDPVRRTPVDLHVTAAVNQPLRIVARAGSGASCEIESDDVLPEAKKHVVTPQTLREKLGRLGGTVFELRDLHCDIQGRPMAPLSIFGPLRRRLVEQLGKSLTAQTRRTIRPSSLADLKRNLPATDAEPVENDAPQLHVLCRHLHQVSAAISSGTRSIYVDFQDIRQYREAVAVARSSDATIFLATPRIEKPGESGIFTAMSKHEADGILVRNLGGLSYFRSRNTRCVGDFSLNAANELSVEVLRNWGAERVTVSYDLNRDQVLHLVAAANPAFLEVVIHQHMPMFHMEHCVFCAVLSPGTNKHNCGRPCDDHRVQLRDRVGMEHPLHADVGCRNTLYNAVPQSSAEIATTLIQQGVRHFRLELLEDSAEQTQNVIHAYRQLLAGTITGREVWQQLKAANRVGVTRGTLEERRNPLAIL